MYSPRDHPRRCGENLNAPVVSNGIKGSPPQVRGKRGCIKDTRAALGDHPRRCGENDTVSGAIVEILGSPPQVRGKLVACGLRLAPLRITPAGAGKTRTCLLQVGRPQDHPRRCGENTAIIPPITATRGSPPQVRGKLVTFILKALSWGITPAGAGKTLSGKDYQPCRMDHPRRCGENDTIISWTAKEIGSPPQVRGKQCGQSLLRCTPGITPAGAGKT